MAKKKGSKVRKKRHLLILEIGGVAVLAALVAGLVLYRNVFSDTRDAVLEEYMGLIEKKEYEKMYDLLDTASQESVTKRILSPETRIFTKVLRQKILRWTLQKNRTPASLYPIALLWKPWLGK